jgi:hypothetical protein
MVVALLHAILFRREQDRIWGGRSAQIDEDEERNRDRTPLLARADTP